MDFGRLEDLQLDTTLRNIFAILLSESGYAPFNPPEFTTYLYPQLSLLSIASADKTRLPSPETLEALQGYNVLGTDVNG